MRRLPISGLLLHTILFGSSVTLNAQTPAPNYAGALSEPIRTVGYAESIYPGGLIPDWDRGYVLSYGIEIYPSAEVATVLMYDQNGTRMREGHIWPTGAGRVRLHSAAATHEGAIIAAGWTSMPDSSSPKFISKTDLAGNTVATIFTGSFVPQQMCEGEDGTVWTLGKDVPATEAGGQTDVLRQYSFEKGLLRSYLPLESVKAAVNSETRWFNAFGSFVRCGKNKVAVYLKFTDEYVEVDTKSLEVKRWKLDLSSADHNEATGLGVADDGRVYASFRTGGCREGDSVLNGLFEIRADSRSSTAALVAVKGTVSLRLCGSPERASDPPAPGTFQRLWGADGNTLAVSLAGRRASDIVWVKVITQEVASN